VDRQPQEFDAVLGRAHPELAEQVAKELDVPVTAQTARDFANGEIFVRFDESVRGCDAFVLQSHPWPLNQWLMEQLIMIDALKRGSAKRITAILPFYPYARQDKKHRGREPISARLVADLLKTAGANRILTVDLHTDQIQGFFDGPVDHMRAQNLLTGHIAENYHDHDMVVVSPGFRPRARGREMGPTPSAAFRWPSSTRPATRWCPTRSSRTEWSVMCEARPAS
jgi:ribose-phosphate pyrophosphokinase